MLRKNVLAPVLLLACLATTGFTESITEKGALRNASEEALEHVLVVQNDLVDSTQGSRIDFSAPLNGEKLWLAEQLHDDHGFNHRHHHHHHPSPGPPGPPQPPPVEDPGSGPPTPPPPPPVTDPGGSGPPTLPPPPPVTDPGGSGPPTLPPPPPVIDPGGSGPPDTPPPPPGVDLGGSGPVNPPSPASVPEPASFILLATGLMALWRSASAAAERRK